MVLYTLIKCMPLRGSPHATEKEDKGDAKCVKCLVVTVNIEQHFTFVKVNWIQSAMFS